MPTYRKITIALVSQRDLKIIPEFPPPVSTQDSASTLPPHVNRQQSVVSVFIPTYSGSQFWISYSIAPPYPPQALYYFKLFLDGACIVSWGCGKEDEFKGETMFGLYESEVKKEGESEIQKRVLCFRDGHEGSDDDILEIKVYRCRGRRPCSPILESYGGDQVGNMSAVKKETRGNISLVNIGELDEGHPQNFYHYALIDPLDIPFARFRYYYRPWAQLQKLGVVYSSSSNYSSSIVSQNEDKMKDGLNKTTHETAPVSGKDENLPQRPIPYYFRHLRPLISRGGARSPPPAPSPSPTPRPSPPTAPLRSSDTLAAVVTNLLNAPAPDSPTRITAPPSGSISTKPTPASFASLVRRSILVKESPPTLAHQPPQPQPQKAPPPRSTSLGLLKSVVTKAVRRRDLKISSSSSSSSSSLSNMSSSNIIEEEEGGLAEAKSNNGNGNHKSPEEEQHPKKISDGVKKVMRPNIPLRTSSSLSTTDAAAITRDEKK